MPKILRPVDVIKESVSEKTGFWEMTSGSESRSDLPEQENKYIGSNKKWHHLIIPEKLILLKRSANSLIVYNFCIEMPLSSYMLQTPPCSKAVPNLPSKPESSPSEKMIANDLPTGKYDTFIDAIIFTFFAN